MVIAVVGLYQILLFPRRPQLADLVSSTVSPTSKIRQVPVATLSTSAIRAMKQKKLRKRQCTTGASTKEHSLIVNSQDIGTLNPDSSCLDYELGKNPTHLLAAMTGTQGTQSSMMSIDLTDLTSAIASLRSKLETVQPEGLRPSDIARIKTEKSKAVQDNGDNTGDSMLEDSNDTVLSQAPISQQSIPLWDDLHLLVEGSTSTSEQERSVVDEAVSELGLEYLEDGVLNRLCIDEIFMQDTTQQAKETDQAVDEMEETELIGPTRGAAELSSQPSRLFLDALLHAGKIHGRAVIDSVVLPLARDYVKFSKPISELVQKVLKEQTSAGLIHFLSHIFEPLNAHESTSTSRINSVSGSIPLMFLTEAHLMTIQTILGLPELPCPLPTRLWSRFVSNLDALWEQMGGLAISCTSMPRERIPEDAAGILKLYYPACLNKDEQNGGENQQVRLTNKVLIQLLLTWTMRQGPHCVEIENLQRLREFCASRVDIKQGKALVSRLDMTLKKLSK
ncbi:hypothetical protein FBU30_008808 [Linnemannia zychae]|nr:hypothetical protein FBU30_008808 [Linnemannia zychae]